MIIWGGIAPASPDFYTNTGGKYDPSTDTWMPTSIANAPAARAFHTAVWTGSEMIVWGGYSNDGLDHNTGGRYNPGTDSWLPTSTTNAPVGRESHTAVWTGSAMIVWGGFDGNNDLNTGGRYYPGTNSWTATSTTNAPAARGSHGAVWTGSEMIVWGGAGASGYLNTGGRYNASTDIWTPTSTANAPSARTIHGPVWTGSEMIVVMIGGFIVQRTGPKRIIIRAIGPELGAPPYNIPNPLANPRLELHKAAGALIGSNDDWQHTIIGGVITRNQVGDIQNSGHAPANPFESAIIADLPPGNYTAIVSGVNNMTGVGLVEVYDLSANTASILGNISTRSFVQTGDNVMIGGFIVQGTGATKVIIRAIGPELGVPPYNIPNALANPTLELHNAAGALIGSNDDWQHTIIGGVITRNQVADIQNSGHAPTDPFESAIIAELPPGNYTAIVRGVNDTTGVGLVEVYDLDQ
jgi:hypothetical protein